MKVMTEFWVNFNIQNIIIHVHFVFVSCGVPVAKAIPKQVVKQVMAMMSSTLHAAMSRVGIPCSKPYPSLCRSSIDGTTTAGETAPRTNLPSRKWQRLGWWHQTYQRCSCLNKISGLP